MQLLLLQLARPPWPLATVGLLNVIVNMQLNMPQTIMIYSVEVSCFISSNFPSGLEGSWNDLVEDFLSITGFLEGVIGGGLAGGDPPSEMSPLSE